MPHISLKSLILINSHKIAAARKLITYKLSKAVTFSKTANKSGCSGSTGKFNQLELLNYKV